APPSSPSTYVRTESWIPGAVADAAKKGGSGIATGLAQAITTASAVYMHCITGSREPILGMALSGRSGARMRTICGLASKVFPLRAPVDPGLRVHQLAAQISERMRTTVQHGRYSPEDLRSDLGLLPNQPRVYGTIANVLPFEYGFDFGGCR